jgi:outer membrane protein OmpA-like peptidoglycan-associated protein
VQEAAVQKHKRDESTGQDAARRDERHDPPAVSPAATVLGLQQIAGNTAVVQFLQDQGALSSPADPHEQEADRVARAVVGPEPGPPGAAVLRSAAGSPGPFAGDPGAALGDLGSGEPLPGNVRAFMEPRFGSDFGDVRVHRGQATEQTSAALGADAFTYGRDIYFGQGRAPAADALTVHELSHVVQQRSATGSLATKRIQRSVTGTFPVSRGAFEIDMQTREGGVATPPTHSGLDGYIRFVPNPDAPNSNTIVMIQIVKLTNVGGADIDPASMPAAQAPRGGLGDPGVRTGDDAAAGVEGGYFTDVHHRPNAAAPGNPQGSPLSPRFNFQPSPAGVAGVGQTQQPAQYGGGTGGVVGQTPGFKRSNDAADIKSAALFDTPGVASKDVDVNFAFESVARGEDTMVTYGSVKWGFGLRGGRVVNEFFNTVDDASATFAQALERHRDFYVHEPVTFYFPFNSDTLERPESAKIDAFHDYLERNPTVRLSLQGFADIRGGASKHNRDLSRNRAEAVAAELVAKGVDPSRIDPITIGPNVPASATTDAGTGDQGGNSVAAADQDREANRQFNRRVMLTFIQTASTPVGGAGP